MYSKVAKTSRRVYTKLVDDQNASLEVLLPSCPLEVFFPVVTWKFLPGYALGLYHDDFLLVKRVWSEESYRMS